MANPQLKMFALAYSKTVDDNMLPGPPELLRGTGDPNGEVTGQEGAYYIDLDTGNLWLCLADDSTTWSQISAGGGPVDLSSSISFTGQSTPAALAAGNTNDYAPDLTDISRLRLAANAAGSTLTGLAGGTDGRVLILTNVSANDLTLSPEDAGSAAANRFAMNGTVIVGQNQSVQIIYDGPLQRWTMLGV